MMPLKHVTGGSPNDPMVQCPNHWTHHVLRSRMSRHLYGCDKQFPLAARTRRLETHVQELERALEKDRVRLLVMKAQIAADEVQLAKEKDALLQLRVAMLR